MSENTEQTVRIFYGRSDIRGLGPDARLYPCGDKPLRPHNDVPLSTWKAFETHPQIKGLIADGSIKVLDAVDEGDEGKGKGKGKGKRSKDKPAEPAAAADASPKDSEPPTPPPGSEAAQALKSLGL